VARHEFDQDSGQGVAVHLPGWLRAVFRFIGRFIDGTFNPDLSSAAGWFRLLVGAGVLVLIVLLAVRLVRRGTTVGPPDVEDPARAAADEPSEDLWRRRGLEARAAGDWAEALRCLYLAGLLRL